MKNMNKDTVDFETYKEDVLGCYWTCLMIEERDETQESYVKSEETEMRIRCLYDNGWSAYDAVDVVKDNYPDWGMCNRCSLGC